MTIYLTDILLGKGKKITQTRTNLIQVQEDHYQYGISQPESRHITTYDPTELNVINHDIRYKQLPFGRVRSICKLKSNKKKRGLRGRQSKKTYQNHQTNRIYMGKFKDITMYTKQRNYT